MGSREAKDTTILGGSRLMARSGTRLVWRLVPFWNAATDLLLELFCDILRLLILAAGDDTLEYYLVTWRARCHDGACSTPQ